MDMTLSSASAIHSDALAVRACFLHGVGVFTHICQRVFNGGIANLAGCIVLGGPGLIRVRFSDFEGEYVFRSQGTAFQRLGAFEGHRHRGTVGVHEVQRRGIVTGGDLQRAVAVVRNGHCHGVGLAIHSDAIAVRAGFLHGVSMFAHIGQRVFNGGIADLAGCIVLGGPGLIRARFSDFEGEYVFSSQGTGIDFL